MRPAPPWTFPNARVLYQPAFVPIEAARAVTPTSGLTLLSLFGWTLGGTFVVEWTDSPIGPYREVAVLSGLVSRGLGIGAWASHIVVTTPEAVDAGRAIFGLPATLGRVTFEPAAESNPVRRDDNDAAARAWEAAAAVAVALKTAMGTAIPGVAEPAERLRPPAAAAAEVPTIDEWPIDPTGAVRTRTGSERLADSAARFEFDAAGVLRFAFGGPQSN